MGEYPDDEVRTAKPADANVGSGPPLLVDHDSCDSSQPVEARIPPDSGCGRSCHPETNNALQDARERHLRFPVASYLQVPPMLFTRDGHNVFLGDMYRGHAAFLLCGGPSLLSYNLSFLQQRGIITCAVNNAAAVFRPHLWVAIDTPDHFCDAIWYDPGIMKFVPLTRMGRPVWVRNTNDQLVPTKHLVADMPCVFGFRCNGAFEAAQWLYEDTFNWGNNSKTRDAYGNKGSRSVFYAALRLLFHLGIRRLYLLGCDFHMEQGRQNYAFEQNRCGSSIRNNNNTYRVLNVRLKQLLPYFEREGYQIFNCTPNSGLTVFPYVPYSDAVRWAQAIMPEKINTAGMYDASCHAKDPRKNAKAKASAAPATTVAATSGSPQNPNGNMSLPTDPKS